MIKTRWTTRITYYQSTKKLSTCARDVHQAPAKTRHIISVAIKMMTMMMILWSTHLVGAIHLHNKFVKNSLRSMVWCHWKRWNEMREEGLLHFVHTLLLSHLCAVILGRMKWWRLPWCHLWDCWEFLHWNMFRNWRKKLCSGI